MALDGRWSGIGWEGEAFCPHLPSSPATERPGTHSLWEGVSLESMRSTTAKVCKYPEILVDSQDVVCRFIGLFTVFYANN